MAFASATISSNRIAERFAALRGAGEAGSGGRGGRRCALVAYVTAGHPSPQASVELMRGLAEAGVDVLEIGVPFSDPLADGPIIQLSSQQALAAGVTLDGCLALAQEAALDVPTILFTYLNPVLSAGDEVLDRITAAGIDGILVTDLPLGADREREEWIAHSDLAYIRLVAPTTPPARVAEIARHASGFVYVISRLGVTGKRSGVSAAMRDTVQRVRAATELPVCVGFGVSTPEQAVEVAEVADGVVVGSAIVEAASSSVEQAVSLARSIREALDG